MSIVYLLIGVFACAVSVIFIQESRVPAAYVAAYRLLIAAVFLSPMFARSLRASGQRYSIATFRHSIVPAVMLAMHIISWTAGARMTAAANATLIVNLSPLAMPFVMYFLAGEIITRREIVGTVIALMGVLVLTASDYHFGGTTIRGDIVCFVSMLLLTMYLALAKRTRGRMSLWVYLVPLYGVAGLLCMVVAVVNDGPPKIYPAREWWLLLGLGLIPTVVGHSLINWSMRRMRGQTVMIINLAQFLFAGVLAYIHFGQKPNREFYFASALVITGAVIVIRAATAVAESHPAPAIQPTSPAEYVDDLQE